MEAAEKVERAEEAGSSGRGFVTPLIRRNAVSELWSFGTWDLSFLGCLVEFLTVRGSGHGFDPRRSPSSGTFGIALQTGVTGLTTQCAVGTGRWMSSTVGDVCTRVKWR